MRRVRALRYGVGRALAGLARAPVTASAVIGAVAVGFLLIGVVHLIAHNVGAVAETWSGRAHMVVYLEAGAPADEVVALEASLSELPVVARAVYVSPAEALARLQRSLGDLSRGGARTDAAAGRVGLGQLLQEEFGAGMLPASIEVTFNAGISDIARADWLPDRLSERVEAAAGVEEVIFVGDVSQRLDALVAGVRYAAWGLLALLGLACVYVVALTMRLRTRVRQREADVMALFGASRAFVRGPLLFEGMIHGTLGAALAMAGLWLLFTGGGEALREVLSHTIGAVELSFVPALHLLWFVAAGAGLGIVGSLLVTAAPAQELA